MEYQENQIFAQRIKELRTELGLTQQQMADMIKVRKTTISNYESGYSTPNLSTIKLFMREFNLPASYFIPNETDSKKLLITKKFSDFLHGVPMHYFRPDNISGLISDDPSRINSTLTLPASFSDSRAKHISTTLDDSTMNLAGIKKGSIVVINTENKSPVPEQIFAAICDGELVVRKYIEQDGKKYMKAESTRIPSGLSLKEIPEENFNVLGVVDAVVSKL